MPFVRYGALAGVLGGHRRDQPDDQGRWYHVHLEVDAPAGRYHCAVDVDSHRSAVGVQWKVLTLSPEALGPAHTLPPGYHDLAPTPGSGALDLLRHPELADRSGLLFLRRPPALLRELLDFTGSHPWHAGANVEAAEALESILTPGRRVLVFGEPFGAPFDGPFDGSGGASGDGSGGGHLDGGPGAGAGARAGAGAGADSDLGMHNVHQNQGDPAGSPWWAENGVWQDGATLTERADGHYDVFLNKFSSQSDRTDGAGHPLA
jgi:hypothetical protein